MYRAAAARAAAASSAATTASAATATATATATAAATASALAAASGSSALTSAASRASLASVASTSTSTSTSRCCSYATLATLHARSRRTALLASSASTGTAGTGTAEHRRHRSSLTTSAPVSASTSTAAAAAAAAATSGNPPSPSSSPAAPSRSYGNLAPSIASTAAGSTMGPPPPGPRSSQPPNITSLHRHRITRLPSPLPVDVVTEMELLPSSASFTDSENIFPTSRRVENMSILKACLATGMIARAEKLFDTLRHEHYLRTLATHARDEDSSILRPDTANARIPPLLYDLLLDCYLHKAASLAQNASADPFSSFGGGGGSGKLVTSPAAAAKAAVTTTAIRIYVQRAWALFGMMNSQQPAFASKHPLDETTTFLLASQKHRLKDISVDPTPSANTLGIMMRGIVRLKQMGAYPTAVQIDSSTRTRSSTKRTLSVRTRKALFANLNTTQTDLDNEGLFTDIYAHIPTGILQADCPALDVLLQAAQQHGVSLTDIFASEIFGMRLPHELHAPAGAAAELPGTDDAPAAAAAAAAPADAASAEPTPRQPSILDVMQEASTTAARMGDVGLSAQLRGMLEEERSRSVHKGDGLAAPSEATRMDGEAASASGRADASQQAMTPEELQATVPIVEPVLTSAHNNPDVKPNAEGLVEPFNLTNLKENLSVVEQSRKMYADPYDRQEWLELSSIDAARKRLAHAASNLESLGLQSAGKLQSKPLQVLMWNWFQELQPRLSEEINRMENSRLETQDEQDVLPFIKFLPVNKLALIPILEVMRINGTTGLTDGAPTARLLILVGKAVEAECMAWMMSQNQHIFVKLKSTQSKMRQRGLLDPATREELARARGSLPGEEVLEAGLPKWTQAIRSRVGGFLVQRLLETAKVRRSKVDAEGVLWDEDQPAFYSTYQYMGGRKLGVIKLNDEISSRMTSDRVDDTLSPRHLPMLVPPRLWETTNRGGYLTARQSLMRYKDSAEQGSYLRAASQNNGLEPIMAGLDVLGQTAWTVNTDVLRVLTELWNRGERVGKLPEKHLAAKEPERPENYDTDLSQRAIYLQRMRTWALATAAVHSQRCDVNYKLEIARAYVGERFYFPHNVDFRGRAYPIPPHLHHLGSDLSRGLLLFADAKPLQATGLKWLRVHLANVYGFDKASFGDRVQFALDNEDNIRKSAEDPINFRWWAEAEEPFQCLAACYELSRAMAHPGGPEAYPCKLPVHQDGTCNGLQHYAALGGDMEGARQVNLSRGDAPADVYTGVAELVIERVEKDAEAGNAVAKLLVGKVTRKVVKQTVMTTVYGVTMIGAKDQVMRRLQDRKDVPAEHLWDAAHYLAKLIISSIGDLFSGAQSIQSWLHDTASLIAKSIHKDRIQHAIRYEGPASTATKRSSTKKTAGEVKSTMTYSRQRLGLEQMTSVIWQTPLGLPVVQPYRQNKKKQMATAVQTVFIHDPLACTQVSPQKQASAFPPNFVHSLDATHMMLTALECHSAGLAFASVHDSYWTHACDIDTMSDIIRDTFVRLHSQDILARLREEFLERYKDHYLPVVRLKPADREALQKSEAGASLVVESDEGQEEAKEGAIEAELTLDATASPSSSSASDKADEDAAEDGELLASADGLDEVAVDAGADVVVEADDGVDAAPAGEDEEGEAVPKKRRAAGASRAKAGAAEKKQVSVRTRFVELSKLIRPLPAKGTFDVSETKKSLYFFS